MDAEPPAKCWKVPGTSTTSLVHRRQVVQNNALRGTLPVYKTTPNPVQHREAAILPIQIILDHKAPLAAARLKRYQRAE